MSSNAAPQHRPLTAKELEQRADELERDGPDPPIRAEIRVAGARRPKPKVVVHADEDAWVITAEVAEVTEAPRLGGSITTRPRPRRRRGGRQIDGNIPRRAAVRTRPTVSDVRPAEIRLRSPKGYVDPLVVFPNDSRQILTDHSWPWRLTGKVWNSEGFSASGVLIGDRLLLTAKHVAPANNIAAGKWWMKFTPNFDNGKSPFGSSFVSDVVWYADESDTEYIVSHDYLVGRLYTPLGKKIGYLGATEFDDDWRDLNVWQNIGYPADIGGAARPVVQFDQSIEDDYEDDDGQYLETEASLNNGNSGGPFFSWFTDGHVRACGVVVGGLTFNSDMDNVLAGGPQMVDLIKWGRATWPA
jgi:V8-like Glu-specific endopeptidase